MTKELKKIKLALETARGKTATHPSSEDAHQRYSGALEAVERLEAERQACYDDYVAWLCHKHSGERQWLAMCDSDTPGAFKVYRRTAL